MMSGKGTSTSGGRNASTRKSKDWVCTYCSKCLGEEAKGMQCDTCESWVCLVCSQLPVEMYDMINKYAKSAKSDQEVSAFKWVCKICDRTLPTLREINNLN